MKNKALAPVLLIAFNRPYHFRATIQSLSRCTGANFTDVFVYIDGPRSASDSACQVEIKAMAKAMEGQFKSLTLVVRPVNFGLKKNITSAITHLFATYSCLIVVEDDLEVSPVFLDYMNFMLQKYSSDSRVGHVNAHVHCEDMNKASESYFASYMCCWGWGTWRDRWELYTDDANSIFEDLSILEWAKLTTLGAGNQWRQVKANYEGRMSSWAIFWHGTLVRNNMLCVTPWVSYSKNIGFDGSGTHTDYSRRPEPTLNYEWAYEVPLKLSENRVAFVRLFQFFLMDYFREPRRIFRGLRRKFTSFAS